MAKPRYVPADFAVDAAAFGRRRVEWREAVGTLARGRLDAAKLQHHAALAVRAQLRMERRRQKDFAADIGFGPERLSRMLNGAAPAALDDVLVLLAGIDVPLARIVARALSPDEADLAGQRYLLGYLDWQREQIAGRIARSAPGRPST